MNIHGNGAYSVVGYHACPCALVFPGPLAPHAWRRHHQRGGAGRFRHSCRAAMGAPYRDCFCAVAPTGAVYGTDTKPDLASGGGESSHSSGWFCGFPSPNQATAKHQYYHIRHFGSKWGRCDRSTRVGGSVGAPRRCRETVVEQPHRCWSGGTADRRDSSTLQDCNFGRGFAHGALGAAEPEQRRSRKSPTLRCGHPRRH